MGYSNCSVGEIGCWTVFFDPLSTLRCSDIILVLRTSRQPFKHDDPITGFCADPQGAAAASCACNYIGTRLRRRRRRFNATVKADVTRRTEQDQLNDTSTGQLIARCRHVSSRDHNNKTSSRRPKHKYRGFSHTGAIFLPFECPVL